MAKKLTFIEQVRNLEIKNFPEFKKDQICSPFQNGYMYFAPSWHFENGLLNQEDIENLKQNNKQLLSVGSGTAYLERFLVKRFGIKKRLANWVIFGQLTEKQERERK